MNSSCVLNRAYPLFCHAQTTPAKPAMVVDGQNYTYADLARAAAQVAAWLQQRRDPDRPLRVGILAARSFETYAGILGTVWAGGAYVPLNPKQPASRIDIVIERAELNALIVDARGLPRARELTRTVEHRLTAPWENLPSIDPQLAPVPVELNDPAYIIFTSGTTGVPKGVVCTNGNMMAFLAALRAIYHFGPDDRFAQFFETTFDVSVSEIFGCFDAGATLYVMPETKQMAPGGFLNEHRITFWMTVPSALQMMFKLKQASAGALPHLRVTNIGGEGFTAELARDWQAVTPTGVVDNAYGPTEATVACIMQRYSPDAPQTPGRGTLAIGAPFPSMHAAIIDANKNFLPQGEVGELVLAGPQLAAGYLNDPEQSARRFPILDHPQLGRSRWYLTGDSALRTEDGRFHCLGRIDHQVKVNGFRVELEEVEAHLREVCKTQTVAAVGWPMSGANASGIVAFTSGSRLGHSDARSSLKDRIPNYMVPNRFIELPALPLSTNGKVDRKALRAILETEQNEAAG